MFALFPAILGALFGSMVFIPVSFFSNDREPQSIKNGVVAVSVLVPIFFFCILFGVIFLVLIKNDFLEVINAFLLAIFMLLTALMPFLAFSILKAIKRKFKKPALTLQVILSIGIVIIGIFLILIVYGRRVYSPLMEKRNPTKIMVIALGGVDWNVIKPLLKENALPNIAQIAQEGSYGSLESLENMASGVTWASGATGGLPENHGITKYGYSNESYRMKTFWEIAATHGMTAGIFEYLVNWPPKVTNGYIIPGWDSFTADTFPQKYNFLKKLEKMEKQRNKRQIFNYLQLFILAVKNGLRLDTLMDSAFYFFQEKFYDFHYLDRYYRAHLLKMALTSDIFTYLQKKDPLDVSVYYNGAIDGLGHFYWRFFEPEKFSNVKQLELQKYGHVINYAYKKMDETIGKILQVLDDNTTVIIFSNHGLKAAPNHPLDRVYYLLNSQKLLRLLDLSNKISVTRMDRMEHLFVNSGKMEELNTLVDRLGEIEFPSNRQKLIKFVRINKDLKLVSVVADLELVTDYEDAVKYRNTRIKTEELLERIEIPFSSVHDRNGIILIKGPRIKRNYEIQDASLIDVTPTILAILGLKAETTMDGRVLDQAFKDFP